METHQQLPAIPEISAGDGGALALFFAAPDEAHAQIDDACRRFTRAGVALASQHVLRMGLHNCRDT
ncbi:MAG: hypothetical protein HOL02_11445 [Rhodospirillaceae bacterium]|nr:hypothetical protein [Rhodospirillaceae bacterium]MBT6511046.1 hypothetical protein [Rhodospirillaceae bacterium]MBT7613416.1 hypothetical protein [Rhodospirillaceae bacterium]